MASKTVTISPAGAAAAGCAATCASYHQGVVPPSYQGGVTLAYTNYQVVATGAGNWRPIKIKVSHFYTYSNGSTSTETITYRSSNYGNPNPWNLPSVKSYTEWENPFEFTETDPGTEWRDRTVDDTITGVEVEFDESTPPTPTTYTITTAASPAAAGTTTGDGTYAAGASCTITATPAAGYVFLRWEKNGVQVSTAPNYVFAVDESATYTAVFGRNTVSITIVARNGWGQVKFEGGTPTTSAWTRVVPAGTTVVMEAIESGTAHFSSWTGPGIGWAGKIFTRVVNADETWTANFYYLCKANAAQIADWTTPLPVGEVRIIDADGATAWNNQVEKQIYNGTSFSVEQRESLQGWHFVKWRYSTGNGWLESGVATLTLQNMSNLEAIALFQRTPTNLPVSSFNRSTPVRILYDDRPGGTGLIVADF